jgi:hypothetical protein
LDLILAFLIIDKYLAWKVGSVSQVRVGQDSISGCGENIFLSKDMVIQLQELGFCTLNRVGDAASTSV